MIVSSTAEIAKMLPYLVNENDRYRKTLENIFDRGYQFEFDVCDPFKFYESDNGKRGIRIVYRAGNRQILIGEIKRVVEFVAEEELKLHPDWYWVQPGGSFTQRWSVGNQYFSKTGYHAKTTNIEKQNWAYILRAIGKLLKEHIIDVESCSRCTGTGYIHQFRHVCAGICFKCGGMGKWFKPVSKKNLKLAKK